MLKYVVIKERKAKQMSCITNNNLNIMKHFKNKTTPKFFNRQRLLNNQIYLLMVATFWSTHWYLEAVLILFPIKVLLKMWKIHAGLFCRFENNGSISI